MAAAAGVLTGARAMRALGVVLLSTLLCVRGCCAVRLRGQGPAEAHSAADAEGVAGLGQLQQLVARWPASWARGGAAPAMGWNAYNHFPDGVTEAVVRDTALALVSSGLADLGYKYINLDDAWSLRHRNAQGQLVPDPVKFPSGLASLADFLHQRGLYLGIYSDAGIQTCKLFPGSLGHEDVDAATFAAWGVDYLKYDNCYSGNTPEPQRFLRMKQALQATGQPIHFSVCEWGVSKPALWARGVGQSWRTTHDIKDSWPMMLDIAAQNNQWAQYAGPGGWNDPDMLEVGNGGMTPAQYRVHFSLWALMKAPLILGNDVRSMDAETLAIISNKEVIDINQDPLGVQGRIVNQTASADVWAGPLSGGRVVVALVNRDPTQQQRLAVDWRTLRLPAPGTFSVRLVWEGKTYKGTEVGEVAWHVKPHSVALMVFTPESPSPAP